MKTTINNTFSINMILDAAQSIARDVSRGCTSAVVQFVGGCLDVDENGTVGLCLFDDELECEVVQDQKDEEAIKLVSDREILWVNWQLTQVLCESEPIGFTEDLSGDLLYPDSLSGVDYEPALRLFDIGALLSPFHTPAFSVTETGCLVHEVVQGNLYTKSLYAAPKMAEEWGWKPGWSIEVMAELVEA